LIRAALELIAQKGPAGFTFAEAARWAGVSPAAPYRHFRDRDELLIDVARRDFDRFAVTLESAWDGGRPDAFTAFERVGKAYLRFATSYQRRLPPERLCLFDRYSLSDIAFKAVGVGSVGTFCAIGLFASEDGAPGSKAIIIVDLPLEPAIAAFEALAKAMVVLGRRHEANFSGLCHPVHREGKILGWQIE